MPRASHGTKCAKGHLMHPISYRDNESNSPARIWNYWYCVTCNKVVKKDFTPKGVYAK